MANVWLCICVGSHARVFLCAARVYMHIHATVCISTYITRMCRYTILIWFYCHRAASATKSRMFTIYACMFWIRDLFLISLYLHFIVMHCFIVNCFTCVLCHEQVRNDFNKDVYIYILIHMTCDRQTNTSRVFIPLLCHIVRQTHYLNQWWFIVNWTLRNNF